jgi:predicted amidohydrolase
LNQKKVRAGFHQFKPQFGKVKENLKNVISTLNNAKSDLIVLPELAFTGYLFENKDELNQLAQETKESFIVEALTKLCKKNGFYIVTGFAEKDKNKLFNSSLLIGPHGIIHTYRKIHLFNLEKYWFDPGDKQLAVQEINDIKIGMMICWDWIYPEVARKLTLLGADIICHPSNLVLPYCQYTMVTRSMENNIFTITANRIGSDKRAEGKIKFTGKSQITGPKGKLIYRAKSNHEELSIFDIDINEARDKSMTSTNELIKDIRPDFY